MGKTLESRLREFEDYRELIHLKARYCDYCDRNQPSVLDELYGPDGIATLFVEDGIWEMIPDGPSAKGREAIRATFVERRTRPFVSSHNVTNPLIKIDGDTAIGQWNAIFYSRSDTSELIAFGIYTEQYVRIPAGWRFKTLRLRMVGAPG